MASQLSPNLNLNFKWSLGEDNWNVGMDENLLKLDSIIHLSVISKGLNSPPSIVYNGDRFIVGISPINEWQSNSNNIAVYDNNTWKFYDPKPGFIVYVVAVDILYVFNYQGTWTELKTNLNIEQYLKSNLISFTPTTDITSSTVQNAIIEVRDDAITAISSAISSIPPQTALNTSFTPYSNIVSTNVQKAIQEVNTRLTLNQIAYPIWKISPDETVVILERQEYGINSGILYVQGTIHLHTDSVLVINN